MNQIKRALISVSDKTGIVELAGKLVSSGVEILSTGGTCRLLKEKGVKVRTIEDYTGFPEILEGRVKTLHPKVHGGILFVRDSQKHRDDVAAKGIEAIDLVIVDLYPFEKVTADPGVSFADAVENIDIGGVTLIRAAAKNHKFVSIVCDTADYQALADEMALHKGSVSEEFNARLARKAFGRTAAYDGMIAAYLNGVGSPDAMPAVFNLGLEKVQELRYGENPHQKAAFYGPRPRSLLSDLRQLHGKELSFNNILDVNAAFEMVMDMDRNFGGHCCVIIKHNNPSGAAIDRFSLESAFRKALQTDPVSAFGGVIGMNGEVDRDTAFLITQTFFEVIIARGFSPGALELLSAKKNLRLITHGAAAKDFARDRWDIKKVRGGLLVQEYDDVLAAEWKTVTAAEPDQNDREELKFAFLLCKFVKSNAIVLSKGYQLYGIGAGQMSRIDSVNIAFEKAKKFGFDTRGCYLASDAFFPFPDSVERAAAEGVRAIVQPGGSVKDSEVIAAADRFSIPMVQTGTRHFRH
jgi:phosphoribosylaminoimidazolecarboxamide formyltransferase/IMP cyclohydrolase